ncbi:MAG: antibiotic biosynthesis monooxygenase [Desulfobacterales bacterium]
MAVKILIKRKFKDGNMQAASRFLINTRTGAMKQPGYIASENLRSLDDTDEIVVVSMWETIEHLSFRSLCPLNCNPKVGRRAE